MNDRYRFRAWNIKNKLYHYDAETTYDGFGGNPVISKQTFYSLLNDDNYIVEQCTGLKDRNQKLIYEGDILDFYLSNPRNGGHYKGVVVWYPLNSLIGWNIEDLGRNGAWDIRDTAHPNDWMIWGEVIGNIHETPDLLENKDD